MTCVEKFECLLRKHTQYNPNAYELIYEGLNLAVKKYNGTRKHVSGQDVVCGVIEYVRQEYGCLAFAILKEFGISDTADIGRLVFHLVEFDLLGMQEEDRFEDFVDVCDLQEELDVKPILSFNSQTGEWNACYVRRSHLSRQ